MRGRGMPGYDHLVPPGQPTPLAWISRTAQGTSLTQATHRPKSRTISSSVLKPDPSSNFSNQLRPPFIPLIKTPSDLAIFSQRSPNNLHSLAISVFRKKLTRH